jgi:hypothetical protein
VALEAATEKNVFAPAQIVLAEGCEVIDGAELTVSATEFELAVPQVPVTMQRYV